MADLAGPQPLVTVVPGLGAGAKAGDALLDILGSYLQATLNAHARGLWTALAPDSLATTNQEVVRKVFTHDPEPAGQEFLDRELPALFLWRESYAAETGWFAQGWRVRSSVVQLAWVFPASPMVQQSARSAFMNLLVSVIEEVLEFRGRDASWIYPGDTDPRASTEGSNLWTFLQVFRIDLGVTQPQPLVIRGPVGTSGVAPKTYFRVRTALNVQERIEQDAAAYFDPEDGLDVDAGIAPDDALGSFEIAHPLFYRSPSVVGITPATGTHLGGTAVTITSDEDTFRTGALVDIGDLPATSVVVVDTKTITAVTPAHGAGAVDVTVTNPNGSAGTLADAFTFT